MERRARSWRNAWIISVVLHSIVVTSTGWMASKELMPVKLPETLIELELSSTLDNLQTAVMSEQGAVDAGSAHVLPVPQVQTTIGAVSVSAETAVAVSAMNIESLDTSTIASAGSVGSGVATVGTNGGQSASKNAESGSGAGLSNSREIIPPSILSRREPAYPEQARRDGVEGTVVLKVEILENGHAGAVSIYQSSGSAALDEAAIYAVQSWRFVPAKVSGTEQVIACQIRIPIAFRLRV